MKLIPTQQSNLNLNYYKSVHNSMNNCYRLTSLEVRDRIGGMKFTAKLLQKIGIKKATGKTLDQYKEELLLKEGREQFIQLIQRGLRIPVQAL